MSFEDHSATPDVSEPGQMKGARGSGLAGLRGKRAKAVEALHIDLPVQRSEEKYGQRVIVRYRAFTGAEADSTRKRFKKDRRDGVDVIANSVILAKCCLGIFTEVERDDPDAWMKFDPELAEVLLTDEDGVVDQSALADIRSSDEVVRLLYITDGDVMKTAEKLSDFSGFSLEELDEDSAGN